MRISLSSVVLLAALVGSLTSCGAKTSQNQLSNASNSTLTYIRVPSAMLTQSWVKETGFNRDHGKDDVFAVGWIDTNTLNRLAHEEKLAITAINELDVAQGLLNPFTLERKSSFFDESEFKEDYHNYVALTAELKALANAHSNLAQLESVGKSNQGRELWLMRISSGIAEGKRNPKLLYIANMHGDEVVGRELSIYHIRRMLTDYGTDARVTSLLDNAELFIIPSMNPDGFEKGVRYNAKNTDLNRDFPDFSSDPTDTPAGRAVETAAIMALHAKHHFVSAINFHGGDVCFNLPWDTKPNTEGEKFGDDHILNPMGRAWANSNPTMKANSGGSFDQGLTYGYEWYEVDGGMQDWSIFYRQSMHATVELSYTKWPNSSTLPKAWNENKEAMLAYLERSLLGVHIDVVDQSGKAITGFEMGVASSGRAVKFAENFGSRTTSSGAQNIVVRAPGYKAASLSVNAKSFDGTYQRIVLQKN